MRRDPERQAQEVLIAYRNAEQALSEAYDELAIVGQAAKRLQSHLEGFDAVDPYPLQEVIAELKSATWAIDEALDESEEDEENCSVGEEGYDAEEE